MFCKLLNNLTPNCLLGTLKEKKEIPNPKYLSAAEIKQSSK